MVDGSRRRPRRASKRLLGKRYKRSKWSSRSRSPRYPEAKYLIITIITLPGKNGKDLLMGYAFGKRSVSDLLHVCPSVCPKRCLPPEGRKEKENHFCLFVHRVFEEIDDVSVEMVSVMYQLRHCKKDSILDDL